jgi:hypothetical protein
LGFLDAALAAPTDIKSPHSSSAATLRIVCVLLMKCSPYHFLT